MKARPIHCVQAISFIKSGVAFANSKRKPRVLILPERHHRSQVHKPLKPAVVIESAQVSDRRLWVKNEGVLQLKTLELKLTAVKYTFVTVSISGDSAQPLSVVDARASPGRYYYFGPERLAPRQSLYQGFSYLLSHADAAADTNQYSFSALIIGKRTQG
jgi:hypothetical protein